MSVQLWVLRLADGLLTLLGEIIVFFGVYSFISSRELGLFGMGLFLVVLGQLAGVSALRYENPKRLPYIYNEVIENVGRQFAYPLLIAVLYFMNKNSLFLALSFALAIIAFVKALFIIYKARIAEAMDRPSTRS